MDLLTRQEAAKRVRVCLRTFEGILQGTDGPKVTRIGRRKMTPLKSLNDWLAARTT